MLLGMTADPIDQILAQWRQVRPDLDLRPMGLIGRFGRFAKLGEKRVEETLAGFDLSIADFDVLASLRRSGPPYRLTPTQLYRTMMITSGTMTNRIDRLEERRLVERMADPDDRRGTLVALTSDGRKLVDNAVAAHLETEADILSGLTRAEQATLDGLLRKLLAGMTPAEGKPAAKRKL